MQSDCHTCPAYTTGAICPGTWEKPYKVCADHKAAESQKRATVLRKIKVRTEHVYPPIPIRDYDWSAVDDNTYDGPGCAIGWGRTEQAAIDDLIEQLSE